MNQDIPVQKRLTSLSPLAPARPDLLQRMCACGMHTIASGECAACRKKREATLKRAAISVPPVGGVPLIVHEVLRSPGQPLDSATRAFMEPRFANDFSRVRVHTDSKAALSAQSVNALAYTVGQNIVFGAGQFAPSQRAGQQLIAHELAHVVQQSSQPSSRSSEAAFALEDADSTTEREADHIFNQIVQGGTARQGLSPQWLGVQRQVASATQAQSQTQSAQQPAPQAQAISTIQNVRVQNVARFDAELDRRAALDQRRRSANEPCRLTLTVRVKFNFRDTQTPNRWTSSEQANWQNAFISAVSNRWSFRFLLVPAQPCASEPCQLAAAIVNIQPVQTGQHNSMNVFYEKPSRARSSVGATSSTLYRPDVERPGRDLRTEQTTATHEAGHLLGLPHVHCSTNNDECYGTNREESADVMGRGEIVTERDYVPFVSAMQQLSGCSWRVRDGRRGPLFGNTSTLLGITLGLAGGLVGGILGAAGGLAGGILGALGGAAAGALIGYGVGMLLD